ncbi:hypothetical protein PIB30_064204 [Stylosanthes scabra]|uniref:Protein YIPF n=1 Tax=Stylosanthes scabra TaxID=79078 RepID=A0ABU6VKW4_9FABA|nr:hypothetical protein [Stylosanthes scabra]
MSFDIGSAAASTSSSTSSGPRLPPHLGPMYSDTVGSSINFDDEEPLLEELRIHPEQIWSKINLSGVNHMVHKDFDLSGPILLYMSFCLFQLLAGKIQFCVILGWIVVSSIFLYVVFNMLVSRGNLDLHTCTNVVGYYMLPVVIYSGRPLVGYYMLPVVIYSGRPLHQFSYSGQPRLQRDSSFLVPIG